MLTGLLEGSRLSPLLFVVFASMIYWMAEKKGLGLKLLNIWLGIIGFADDKATMAQLMHELQKLVE